MKFKLIPAIDIIDHQLVRLFKGDYNQKTNYSNTPLDMALYYKDLGISYIHIVDLNGAKDGELTNLSTIKEIIDVTGLDVQVGGGVRSLDHVEQLFSIGVAAVIIGSMLVKDFDLISTIIQSYPQKIIAGLDVQGDYIATHGWTETSSLSLDEMLKKLAPLPLHSIVTTDIQKDGTFLGPNISLYESMSKKTAHPIIASGGVSDIRDLYHIKELGIASGCIIGKAIIEGRVTDSDVHEFLKNQ